MSSVTSGLVFLTSYVTVPAQEKHVKQLSEVGLSLDPRREELVFLYETKATAAQC